MIDRLKKLFSPSTNEEVNLSRRKFIKTASALAALTVAAVNVPSLLKIREIEEQIASGRVFGQTFYISETIVIDIPDVVIDQCEFIAVAPMEYMMEFGSNARNCRVQNSKFEAKGLVGTVVKVNPQSVSQDMTVTFQSAIDAAQGGGTIKVAEGTYYTNRAIKMPNNGKLLGERPKHIPKVNLYGVYS